MMGFGNRAPVRESVPASNTDTNTRPAPTRVLVSVEDLSQVRQAVELALGTGASQARVLHLSLREIAGGRRFSLETEAEAARIVEATVLELRMAGIETSGVIRYTMVGKEADAIVAEAAEWGAEEILLGSKRRGQLATRLLGSVTLRVLQHAPCPVLVAAPAPKERAHRGEEIIHHDASALTGTPAR
jgi:nucleotide-binding universal stress UspA family protein